MLEPEKYSAIVSKYGPIFSVQIKGSEVFFRELTFSEFDYIVNIQKMDGVSTVDSEDLIIKTAVVHPEDLNVDKLPAGVVTNLCQQILDVSGFNSPQTAKKILDQKREDAAQVRSLMKAFVLTTIKGYTPENLDDMTYSQLAERVALSEKIIEITQALHSIEPNNLKLQLIDPKEEEKKAKIKAAKYNMAKPHGAADYEDPIAQKLWGIKK